VSRQFSLADFVQRSSENSVDIGAPFAPSDAAGEESVTARRLFGARDVFLSLAIAALTGAAYLPIMRGMLSGTSDYTAHAEFARRLAEQGVLVSPACLLHVLIVALVRSGLAATYESAALTVAVCSHAAVGAALYLCARWALGDRGRLFGRIVPAIIAVIGPFVQPPVGWRARYFIGYIWAEPYHSPTYALLKPFALLAAVFAVYFFSQSKKNDWKSVLLCSFAVGAGTLSKPSFAICAFPAVVLYSADRYVRKAPFSKMAVLCGWLIPALAVLMWQYYRTYQGHDDPSQYSDRIIFAPLVVMRLHAKHLAAPYFWSILLPLCVLLAYGKRAWADTGLKFSLLTFLFGTLYAYTLAEQLRLQAGNFLWSAYITLFVVYFFSVVFVFRQVMVMRTSKENRWRARVSLAALAWQLTSGIAVHLNYVRLY
jgi:hypothetical protein